MPTSHSLEPQLNALAQTETDRAVVTATLSYIRDLEAANAIVSGQINDFMNAQREKIAELVRAADFGQLLLLAAKRTIREGDTDGWCEEVMGVALEQGVGNVQRVVYDPAVHGEIKNAQPGDQIWWWGK